ncbi:response regulator transcription factor [Arcobacter aquimarinus]|uniref:Two-component system response regulator n=1 Tax=Arcobacter aquimarinus TaxID=1315211 RepID=A0AAE7E239_9BACT|nr:response regulator [Arcobacter aquimarinus]QKE26246.1 two-component system response regulator [Arcobacter aquimarinus]RXI35756.1 response regulator receiver protein [Arcobacter aquimarinus]
MQVDKIKDIIIYTKNLNVLYVEDSFSVQQQTMKMLSSFFKKIELANNGKIALEIFEKYDFDLIITDIKMPLLDGIGFIETIRNSDKKIPIIVLSAHDDKDYFLKSINAGIDGYILKPYTLEQIIQTLSNIVEKYDFTVKIKNTIKLKNEFIWNKDTKQLSKDNKTIKLSRLEQKIFDFFISSPQSASKSYSEIEYYMFDNCEDNTKKLRNLINRLRLKLNYDLFETVYSYGYTLKYEDE